MGVTINLTEQKYGFIDGATGQELTPEEFAKKYPGVGLGGNRTSNVSEEDKR